MGPLAIGERLGRNARFASLGNGVAAAVMGTAGYLVSSRSVFLVTFILAIPTLLSLSRIRESEVDVARAHGAIFRETPDPQATSVVRLVRKKPLLIFAGCVTLLQLANAAMLPLMAGIVTTRSSQWAPVLIAFCIVVPQAIVALMSPTVGAKAQLWGRRPLLLIGFTALAIRGLLFAMVHDPYVLVAVQVFDGITAAVFAVLIPLTVADLAFGSGHFNLAQGIVGTRDRHRRLAVDGACRLCQRQVWQQHCLSRACRRRRIRSADDCADHAGDAPGGGVRVRRPVSSAAMSSAAPTPAMQT